MSIIDKGDVSGLGRPRNVAIVAGHDRELRDKHDALARAVALLAELVTSQNDRLKRIEDAIFVRRPEARGG